jgi:hypothetical protein
MIKQADITLCCVDCSTQALAERALALSLPALPFKRALLLTDCDYPVASGIECIRIPSIGSRADRKSTRLNSSHNPASRMPSSA